MANYYWNGDVDGDLENPDNYIGDDQVTVPEAAPLAGDIVRLELAVVEYTNAPTTGTAVANWELIQGDLEGGTYDGEISLNGGGINNATINGAMTVLAGAIANTVINGTFQDSASSQVEISDTTFNEDVVFADLAAENIFIYWDSVVFNGSVRFHATGQTFYSGVQVPPEANEVSTLTWNEVDGAAYYTVHANGELLPHTHGSESLVIRPKDILTQYRVTAYSSTGAILASGSATVQLVTDPDTIEISL